MNSAEIDLASSSEPSVLALLRNHPRVKKAQEGPSILQFQVGDWHRKVLAGDPDFLLAGLVELMDNNPLVCADTVSVPDAFSTLALIALGPLIESGLIVEPPVILASHEFDEAIVDGFLTRAGWEAGFTASIDPVDLGSVRSINALAKFRTLSRPEDLDDLYDERFGRSFFVREVSEWDTKAVAGTPYAAYRLRLSPGEEFSLLGIQVMADIEGKLGATQVIHAMNIMTGFEESLGLL